MAPPPSAGQHLSKYECLKATLEARGGLVEGVEVDPRSARASYVLTELGDRDEELLFTEGRRSIFTRFALCNTCTQSPTICPGQP